jgi:hypothetical protein
VITANRLPGVNREADENGAAGGLSALTLQRSADNRPFLRRLLARIEWAEPARRRAVQDAITDALAETWIWRSYAFEQARPRPGDFTGHATPAELAAADERCAGVALACRNHADALAWGWFE